MLRRSKVGGENKMKLLNFFITFVLALIFSQTAFAQTEKLGIIKYAAPAGFSKSAQEHAVVFSVLDQAKGNFCFITLYAAGASSGSAQQDFSSEWKTRVVDPWKGEANPKTETVPDNGWTAIAGGAPIEFQGNKAFAFLTVISGFGKTVSVLGILNDDSYLAPLQAFVEKIDIDKSMMTAGPAAATPASVSGSASVPGPPKVDDYGHIIVTPPTRQLTLADIAGQWGENEGINITYVNRYSGTYAGADSLHYRSKMTFTAAGGYYDDFYAIQNGAMIKEKTAGSVSINGRVLTINSRNPSRYVIRGWLELPDMTIFEVCGPWYMDDPIPQEIFNNPVQGANLNKKWVRKK